MTSILIADDHAAVRRGVRSILLEKFPFAVIEEAADAEEVIQKTIQTKFDLVVSDISMPGRTGIDMLLQLKTQSPKLPVLIHSMHPEDQYAKRVLKAGGNGYITKDASPEEFIRAVEKILAGKKYVSAALAEQMADDLNRDTNKLPHEILSHREYDVFVLLAAGSAVSQIAERFSLSVTTISTYRTRILQKMELDSNSALTRYALGHALI